MELQKLNLTQDHIHPLHSKKDLDPFIQRVGDAEIVMLGEASHGTHEYYTWRSQISQRLISEKSFNCIAVEGDWPDCMAINKYVKNYSDSTETVQEVLSKFNRWPTWMWANWEIAALATWLREHNGHKETAHKVGFYGMDVYSLWDSLKTMVDFLETEDPEAASLAKDAYRCFQPYEKDDSYASAVFHNRANCREQVIHLLSEISRKAPQYDTQPEAGLNAEINSLVIANAERYYKAMTDFNQSSWNVRDRHMMQALEKIKSHGNKKIIVWAHNTHVGDARATNMADNNMVNIGQLAREQYGNENVVLLGFGCYSGSVIAGSAWGAPMQEMDVPESPTGTVESILNNNMEGTNLLVWPQQNISMEKKGHRAIGVVYHPKNERGNYVPTQLRNRYDAFIFIPQTTALHPLIKKARSGDMPDTYPFGI